MGEFWLKICSLAVFGSVLRRRLFPGRRRVDPSVRWKMETRVRARLRTERGACLSVSLRRPDDIVDRGSDLFYIKFVCPISNGIIKREPYY